MQRTPESHSALGLFADSIVGGLGVNAKPSLPLLGGGAGMIRTVPQGSNNGEAVNQSCGYLEWASPSSCWGGAGIIMAPLFL